MPRTLPFAACMALTVLPCCIQDAAAPRWPLDAWLVHDEAGVAVAIPQTWVPSHAVAGVMAGGAEGAPDYLMTLAIQAVLPLPKVQLAQLLESAYVHRDVGYSLPSVTTPCIAGDALGLCYSVSFTVFDEPRRRVGVLIDLAPYVVDLSLVGPATEVDDHVEIFERALETLYIEPAG